MSDENVEVVETTEERSANNDSLFVDSPVETETEPKSEVEATPPANEKKSTEAELDPNEKDVETGKAEEDEKPQGRAGKRIHQLSTEKKQALARAEQAEAKLEEWKAQQTQQEQMTKPSDNVIEPDIDDFDVGTDEGFQSYMQAYDQYEAKSQEPKNEPDSKPQFDKDELFKEFEARQKHEQEQKELVDGFKNYAKDNPTFKDDFKNLQGWMDDKPVQADLSQVYQGEEMLDVLAEIASSVDTYYKLADMNEAQQYVEYGKIHARIEARKQATKEPIKHTNAPPPPNHGGSNSPIQRDPESLTDDEYYDQQTKNRGK